MALATKKRPAIAKRITLSPSSQGVELNQSPRAGESPQHKALEIAINQSVTNHRKPYVPSLMSKGSHP